MFHFRINDFLEIFTRIHSRETKSTQEYTQAYMRYYLWCSKYSQFLVHSSWSLEIFLQNLSASNCHTRFWSKNEPFEILVKNDQFRKLPLDVLLALEVLSLNERIDIFYHTDTFRYLQKIDIIRFYTARCSKIIFIFCNGDPKYYGQRTKV